MSDFEKAKAALQRKQGSTSLYDHLSEVLVKIVSEDPANSLALFEQISASVKRGAYPGETTGAPVSGKADDAAGKAASLAWSAKAAGLFVVPEPAEGVTPGETSPPSPLYPPCTSPPQRHPFALPLASTHPHLAPTLYYIM